MIKLIYPILSTNTGIILLTILIIVVEIKNKHVLIFKADIRYADQKQNVRLLVLINLQTIRYGLITTRREMHQ